MSRAARRARVFFFEEPLYDGPLQGDLQAHLSPEGVTVCVPHLPAGLAPDNEELLLRKLLDEMIEREDIRDPWCWYYSPMMWTWSQHVASSAIIYDCMDELAAFAGAPPELKERERALMRAADVVFTGGQSLYQAKRTLHPQVHAFPSSVDAAHFARATELPEPADQHALARPRVGFFGVIDERLDIDLIRELAEARPSWQIVMLGPVVKIDPAILPRAENLHWLGSRPYADLPAYLGGWDVAILPFALNDATRFISPTKTLEYLAAGRAVVSTPIADVVEPYGTEGVVRIAMGKNFVTAIEEAFAQPFPAGRRAAEAAVARTSWDRTWDAMAQLISAPITVRAPAPVGGASTEAVLATAHGATATGGRSAPMAGLSLSNDELPNTERATS